MQSYFNPIKIYLKVENRSHPLSKRKVKSVCFIHLLTEIRAFLSTFLKSRLHCHSLDINFVVLKSNTLPCPTKAQLLLSNSRPSQVQKTRNWRCFPPVTMTITRIPTSPKYCSSRQARSVKFCVKTYKGLI